jgi:FkbM family methyltransferase
MIRGLNVALVAATTVQAVHVAEEEAAPLFHSSAHALAASTHRIVEGASLIQLDQSPSLPTCDEKACWKWDWSYADPNDQYTWQPRCSPESPSLMEQEHEQRQLDKEGFKINYAWLQPSCGFYRDDYTTWEPETFNVFRKLATDKVVLDVGAWVGPTALWLANAGKKVFALEPTQTAFAEMCSNYKVNPNIKDKLVAINAALDSQVRITEMTNRGNSADALVEENHNVKGLTIATDTVPVQTMTIEALEQKYPELSEASFVKMDTEGYERVLVPAMENFFKTKKPNAYISLHPQYNSPAVIQGTVDKLKEIFPYLYEVDMKTPFRTDRATYDHGDHGGSDVVCAWEPML